MFNVSDDKIQFLQTACAGLFAIFFLASTDFSVMVQIVAMALLETIFLLSLCKTLGFGQSYVILLVCLFLTTFQVSEVSVKWQVQVTERFSLNQDSDILLCLFFSPPYLHLQNVFTLSVSSTSYFSPLTSATFFFFNTHVHTCICKIRILLLLEMNTSIIWMSERDFSGVIVFLFVYSTDYLILQDITGEFVLCFSAC